ncbi:MAG: citryl-CoA lyase [Variovorax sp.]
MKKHPPLRSAVGASAPDRIMVYGHDFVGELLGQATLSSMAFLALTGRKPSANEARVFDAIAITLIEHGMTPMAMATRLTYLGAPESLQGAVAAGLLGMGTRFGGGAEAVAAMLRQALPDAAAAHDTQALAVQVFESHAAGKRPLPGLGHNIHKPIDPRTPKLFEIAREAGFEGPYVALLCAIADVTADKTGKVLPVNATGAIGALCCELKLPAEAPRGIAVFARAIGLVGHLVEEGKNPIGRTMWERVDEEINAAHFSENSAG